MFDPLFWKYLEESKRLLDLPWEGRYQDLICFYSRWKKSQEPGRSPLVDEIPWITFSAIQFLKRILSSDMRVFEYGSGGSTLFFARRVSEVISVEHDDEWADKVHAKIAVEGFTNCRLQLVAPQLDTSGVRKNPADPASYSSRTEQFVGYDFSSYVKTIDAYSDETFDLVVIDGRARPSCFLHALPKVRPGGHILWDNTDRKWYAQAMRLAGSDYVFSDFPGPSPYVTYFTRTSIWQRIR